MFKYFNAFGFATCENVIKKPIDRKNKFALSNVTATGCERIKREGESAKK